MNPFDAAIYGFLILAMVMGFNAGLLRSLATIVGYVAAMPLALAAAPLILSGGKTAPALPAPQAYAIMFAIFLATGFLIAAGLRFAVREMTGPDINIADRAAGATLGALRVMLLAVAMVLIFERIIPKGHEPQFLAGSHLRPLLSVAAAQGVKSLPPEVAGTIDRLKAQHGI